jgi:hypothetical protein
MFPAGSGSPFVGGPPPAPTSTTTRFAWITTDTTADCLAHAILDRTAAPQGLELEAHPEASAPRLLDDVHLGAIDVMLIPQDLAQQLPPAAYHWEDRGRVTGGPAPLLLRSSVEWRTTVDAIVTRPDWNTDTAMTSALQAAAETCPGATVKTSVPPPGY